MIVTIPCRIKRSILFVWRLEISTLISSRFTWKLDKAVSSRLFDTLSERYTLKHTDLDALFDGEYASDEVIEMVSELIGLKLLLADPVKRLVGRERG